MKHSLSLLFTSLFLYITQANCTDPLVPALYVFGDSLSDSGNNNFLRTTTKVNYKPYGIDFLTGVPTGRFTNGKTFIDFIADYLGLPLVPAYLSLSEAEKMNIRTGVNYASGAAGILPETGTATGDILSLDEQIECFQDTVIVQPELLKYLAESIFFVKIGNNDYINNYLQPANYPSSQQYTPQEFAELLIDRLRNHLIELYNLGARKFVVFNIARLGCVPGIVNSASPGSIIPCAEDINNLVLLYNSRLPAMITTLEHTQCGSTFVHGDIYNMNKSSFAAGFIIREIPCCESSEVTGLCVMDSTPCLSRATSIFWDAFHPSEIVNFLQAIDCFTGFSSCTPINVQLLALKK